MDIKRLTDEQIEKLLKEKVREERETTARIIEILQEVQERRLHLARGYGSLIEYCIKELGYSESSAYRRVQAMRIAREIPEIRESIRTGEVTLFNLARAQTFFKHEAANNSPVDLEIKRKVIDEISKKTAREAEKVLLTRWPNALPQERSLQLTPQHKQISFVINEQLCGKLERVKSHLSHRTLNPSYAELLEHLADAFLKRVDSGKISGLPLDNQGHDNRGRRHRDETGEFLANDIDEQRTRGDTAVVRPRAKVGRYIPQVVRREVWRKGGGECSFVDPVTTRKCTSNFQLQIEHKLPLAKGGGHEPRNLEVLCAAHNRLRAVQEFGSPFMKRYLKK